VVKDSDTTSPQLIPVKGTGIATSVSPTSLAYDAVTKGSTKVLSTTVSNKGTAALSISAGTVSGTNAADFTFTTTCGSSLAAGSLCSCSYTVTVKPSTTRSERSDAHGQRQRSEFSGGVEREWALGAVLYR